MGRGRYSSRTSCQLDEFLGQFVPPRMYARNLIDDEANAMQREGSVSLRQHGIAPNSPPLRNQPVSLGVVPVEFTAADEKAPPGRARQGQGGEARDGYASLACAYARPATADVMLFTSPAAAWPGPSGGLQKA